MSPFGIQAMRFDYENGGLPVSQGENRGLLGSGEKIGGIGFKEKPAGSK